MPAAMARCWLVGLKASALIGTSGAAWKLCHVSVVGGVADSHESAPIRRGNKSSVGAPRDALHNRSRAAGVLRGCGFRGELLDSPDHRSVSGRGDSTRAIGTEGDVPNGVIGAERGDLEVGRHLPDPRGAVAARGHEPAAVGSDVYVSQEIGMSAQDAFGVNVRRQRIGLGLLRQSHKPVRLQPLERCARCSRGESSCRCRRSQHSDRR